MEFDHRYEIAGDSPLVLVCLYCESDFVYYNRSFDVWPEKCPLCRKPGFWRKSMEPLVVALMRIVKNLIDEEVELRNIEHEVVYGSPETNKIHLEWSGHKFTLEVTEDGLAEPTGIEQEIQEVVHKEIQCIDLLDDSCVNPEHYIPLNH